MSRPSVPCEIRIAKDIVPGDPSTVEDISWEPCREPAVRFFYHPGRRVLVGLCERHLDSTRAMDSDFVEVLDKDEIPAIQVHSS